MYKYLYWVFVLMLVILRRVFGLIMIWIAIPFRAYSRNVVYNYHLQNDIILKRLYERNPEPFISGWILNGGHHSSEVGIVNYKKISKIEYYLVLWFIWLWLDDDCNQDTYDAGYNKTIINGERMTWLPNFIKNRLAIGVGLSDLCMVRGNSFDLGDVRGKYPLFECCSVLLWTIRNTAYNFNYKFHQLTNPELAFTFIIGGRIYGWAEDGMLGDIQTYSWELGRPVKD